MMCVDWIVHLGIPTSFGNIETFHFIFFFRYQIYQIYLKITDYHG